MNERIGTINYEEYISNFTIKNRVHKIYCDTEKLNECLAFCLDTHITL